MNDPMVGPARHARYERLIGAPLTRQEAWLVQHGRNSRARWIHLYPEFGVRWSDPARESIRPGLVWWGIAAKHARHCRLSRLAHVWVSVSKEFAIRDARSRKAIQLRAERQAG